MTKSIVVLSGGQDSATALLVARQHSDVVGLLHFVYGQRHQIERDSAEFWSNKFNIPMDVLTIESIAHLGHSALLRAVGGDVSKAHPVLKDLPASFVPGRNLMFLTFAAAYALKVGATEIWMGVCQTDFSGYPDCRAETIDAMETAINHGMGLYGTEGAIKIVTPLMDLTKADTFRLAEAHGALADVILHTHTCYLGDRGTLHPWGYGCGECPACVLRERGWNEYEGNANG